MLRVPLKIYDNSDGFSTTTASHLPVLSKYGVLVAEDVAQERELLVAHLSEWGLNATTAVDGKEALSILIKNDTIRLLIADLHMPGLGGLELLQEVKNLTRPKLYSIVLGGIKDTQTLINALQAGATDYMVKPCHPEQIFARLAVLDQVMALEEKHQALIKDLFDVMGEMLGSRDSYSLEHSLRIAAISRRKGRSLQRQRSWCISTDKNFASKAADIVGLYLDPPLNAVVLCVDEKPSIQALERKTGYIKTDSGKVVRAYKSTYKRQGTLNLFAALEVSTGKIQGKVTETKKRADFQSFMDEIVTEYSPDQEMHVILDNYCTHKKKEEWLLKNKNVRFHFTPTSASWLNQVEIWFGIFSRKALRGASFTSPRELRQRIEDFIERYNPDSRPFKWRKREVKGVQIKDTIENLSI